MNKRLLTLIIICLVAIIGGTGSYIYQHQSLAINKEISPIQPDKTTAIFAAYSADGSVSDYVISYLKALKEVSPNIIFITDNKIQRKEIQKLAPYTNQIIAQRHGEYDWGSFKRGVEILKQNGWLTNHEDVSKKEPLLIFANDSSLLVAPTLSPIFTEMSKREADFWGITANEDGMYHLQSYFLAFTPKVYQSIEFRSYLQTVKAEKDGLTVAYRYEVPLTSFLENLGYKSSAYIPYEDLRYLPLNDKNCYPLALLGKHNAPFLKMRTFTKRLNIQDSRRLVFHWVKEHNPQAYQELITHLRKINSPYLKEARE